MWPTVQALMRHANVSVTMNTYVQAVTPAKRSAQRGIIKQIREVAPDPNLKCLQVLEKMVGAIGFEHSKTSFQLLGAHGGHRKAVEDSGRQR
jgi:hypothetical protein